MTKLSKFFAVAIAAFVVLGFASSVKAAQNDTFTINVTVQYMEIVLNSGLTGNAFENWNLGTLALGGSSSMSTKESCVRAEMGNTNFSSKITASVTTGAGSWTVADAIGSNVFSLEVKGVAKSSDLVDGEVPDFTAAGVLLAAAPTTKDVVTLNSGEDGYLFFKFNAPNANTLHTQQAITVTVNVTSQ